MTRRMIGLLAMMGLLLVFSGTQIAATESTECPASTKSSANKKSGAALDAYQQLYKSKMDGKVKDVLEGDVGELDDVKKYADCVKYMQELKNKRAAKNAVTEPVKKAK